MHIVVFAGRFTEPLRANDNRLSDRGVVGTLKLTDAWSLQGGLVLGSDLFIGPADRPTGIGSRSPDTTDTSLAYQFESRIS
jgi:hypothetical protein